VAPALDGKDIAGTAAERCLRINEERTPVAARVVAKAAEAACVAQVEADGLLDRRGKSEFGEPGRQARAAAARVDHDISEKDPSHAPRVDHLDTDDATAVRGGDQALGHARPDGDVPKRLNAAPQDALEQRARLQSPQEFAAAA
jgi:hypothetical protein